ncbi:MAG: sigma 54-interacting transcriptional regulator [Deltaproteobacteria bacterium]|nr:sigma 54-interacting transcriptional regulator [Deltaproteobacteria bacterium]
MGRILVIDDDLSLREMLEMMLRGAGHQVSLAEDGLTGLAVAGKDSFDLIISDLKMPGLSGLDLLKRLRSEGLTMPLILVSAFARPDMAVEAMRGGAYDFIPKPFKPHDLLAVVDSALAHQNVEQERQALAEMVLSSQCFGGMVGSSPAMLPVYDLVRRAAQTSTSILITGESGTGKELVARAVHENSDRADHEFVAINCGGVPENLLESELFGYKKGAFTGAAADKKGLVAMADGGTLFLDELAELTQPMQVKLLRVIQEKTFRPVGGDREERSDVRFISATNKNLEAEIISGRFREDLYYRLNVINIHLPPLRERTSDIPVLAHFFLEKFSRDQNKDVRKLSAYALDILSRYHFPGNVRELENIIERSVALEQSNIILPESLRLADFKQSAAAPSSAFPTSAAVRSLGEPPELLPGLPAGGLDELMGDLEAYYFHRGLLAARGVRGRAAAALGISPWRLRTRLVACGLADLSFQELLDLEEDRFPKPDLPPGLAPDWTDEEIALDDILIAVERHFFRQALAAAQGNKTESASLLGLSRRSFHHRLDRPGGAQPMDPMPDDE